MAELSATFTTEGHKPVLIEDWLPLRELGVESVRESAPIPGQFPKLKTIHTWWARAPLAASSGVVLASLLPSWDDSLPETIEGLAEALERVRSERTDLRDRREAMTELDWYRLWVLRIGGVLGDSVGAKERLDRAKQLGESIPNPHAHPPAFKNRPAVADLLVLDRLLRWRWGRTPVLLDPTAGGGSIPYSAARLGISVQANDLNAVAATTLDVAVRIAHERGAELVPDLEKWGDTLVKRCQERLADFFPADGEFRPATYLYVHAVRCPRTGGIAPLAPNWWIARGEPGIAAKPVPEFDESGEPAQVRFEIGSPRDLGFDPSAGSVSRGTGISIWDGLVIDGDYIKSEAQAGRLLVLPYAVAHKRPKKKGRGFDRSYSAPSKSDLMAIEAAARRVSEHLDVWKRDGVVPTGEVPDGNKTSELLRYGYSEWTDLHSDRQLMVHATLVSEWRAMLPEVVESLGRDRGSEVMTVLALMQGKALTFNSKLTPWVPQREMLSSVFDRHDFAFKWTFGEFEAGTELLPWCLNQVIDAFKQIAELMTPVASTGLLAGGNQPQVARASVGITCGSASQLSGTPDESVECVNIDPPYYDNVMYGELSDFYYVWEYLTLKHVRPAWFEHAAANKDDEAVANLARFSDAGKRKKELANFDYQQKMQAIFAECHRVLVDDGVMVVWFTHKRAEAWDTLATAMMEAGFTIEASWPVATQSETSMHHAKKNSAKSTIILVCRKRQAVDKDETFFEDIEVELRQAARVAVEKFEREVGVGGVDLQLATYGPTLSVISRNWPVLSSEPDETGRSRRLRPEEALDVARQEVARLRMQRLVGKDATFDPATDFWLMCWETFQAREFPYDEARKLALGVGHDVDEAIKAGLLKKKASNVELVNPTTRGRALRRLVDDSGRFEQLVDALHFMLVTYRDDKLAAARTWLSDSGYGSEQRFIDVVQAAVNAVPRVRTKKGLSLEEAVLLEDAVVALFGDEISLPVEAEEKIAAEQMTLGG